MSLGGVLWSAGSGGYILSQASNYKAEPHSKDLLLIDYTSPTSNKTKVGKILCVCGCVFEGEMDKEHSAENTVTHSSLYGTVNVCVCAFVAMPGQRGTEKASGLIYKMIETRCCPLAEDNASHL